MHVELQQVSKRYGRMRALDQVSLAINSGQIVALIGLNGAGKTTLLRCLSGIVAPTDGKVFLDRELFHRERLNLRRRLMFIPDFPIAYGHLNVLQHVSLLLRVYGKVEHGSEDIVLKSLAELDLLGLAEAPLAELSRGQFYKAALAALVAVDADLWLLDEPFASGLDPQGLAMLKDYARARARRQGTVIYTTQILEIAEKFCDLLVVIDQGRVAATYSRADLGAFPMEGPESLEARLRQFRAPVE